MFLITTPTYNPGMFSCFASVLGALHKYEIGELSEGLKVQFDSGRYVDPARGGNWWDYHMEPLEIKGNGEIIDLVEFLPFYAYAAAVFDRRKAFNLISKYMRPLPEVIKQVDDFYEKNLRGKFVLGVHYRGTDKREETRQFISRDNMLLEVSRKVYDLQRDGKDIVLFVASDEEGFVSLARQRFNDVKFTDIPRSKSMFDSLHATSSDRPFEMGREALVDCLLLSRSDFLIRTTSNMGFFAEAFSPDMKSVRLNSAPWEEVAWQDQQLDLKFLPR